MLCVCVCVFNCRKASNSVDASKKSVRMTLLYTLHSTHRSLLLLLLLLLMFCLSLFNILKRQAEPEYALHASISLSISIVDIKFHITHSISFQPHCIAMILYAGRISKHTHTHTNRIFILAIMCKRCSEHLSYKYPF